MIARNLQHLFDHALTAKLCQEFLAFYEYKDVFALAKDQDTNARNSNIKALLTQMSIELNFDLAVIK